MCYPVCGIMHIKEPYKSGVRRCQKVCEGGGGGHIDT